ncbi:MAG: hypothetical protein VX669_07255, partial [Planctomycetota bacterium]|nr:hypothetical protein [Planctomycetota bacterium]
GPTPRRSTVAATPPVRRMSPSPDLTRHRATRTPLSKDVSAAVIIAEVHIEITRKNATLPLKDSRPQRNFSQTNIPEHL